MTKKIMAIMGNYRRGGMNTIKIAAIVLAGVTGLTQRIRADDAYVEVQGGAIKLISGLSSVRMVGEDVKIIINSTSTYDVDASFVFYNESQSTTVLVGFPMSGWSPENRITGEFRSFKTFVNGKEVAVLNRYKDAEGDEMPVNERWKVKEVYFPQNKKTITRVQYTAPYGHYSGGALFIDYVIGTGASWYGNIGISTFTMIFPDDFNSTPLGDTPFRRGSVLEGKCEFIRTRNTMTWRTPEFKPGLDDTFSVYIEPGSQPWTEPESNTFNYASEPVDIQFLEKLSIKQLKLLRNEIFARHGRIFADTMLRKYFSAQPWYKQNPNFKDSELNEIEKENSDTIFSYEKKLIKGN